MRPPERCSPPNSSALLHARPHLSPDLQEVRLVQSGAAAVEVMNAVVLEAHHFVQTHTNMQGGFEVTLLEDDSGYAQRRRVYMLPFVSDAFEVGNLGFMKEHPHTKFGVGELESGEEESTGPVHLTVTHGMTGKVAIADHISIQVVIRVRFWSVFFDHTGPDSCPASDVLMCAFDDNARPIGCEKTDAEGYVALAVPPGVDITVRNGCEGPKPTLELCRGEGLRPDLEVTFHDTLSPGGGPLSFIAVDEESGGYSVDNPDWAGGEITKARDDGRTYDVLYEDGDSEKKVKPNPNAVRVKAEDVGSYELVFVDTTQRLLEVVYGAGSTEGLERAAASIAPIGGGAHGAIASDNRQLFPLNNMVASQTRFVAAHALPACSMMLPVEGDATVVVDAARYQFSIPRDLSYQVTALVDDNGGESPVRDFLALLPNRELAGCKPKAVDKWNEKLPDDVAFAEEFGIAPKTTADLEIQAQCVLPVLEFLYRKPPTVELRLADADGSRAACPKGTPHEGVFNVPQSKLDGKPNQLTVQYYLQEGYEASEAHLSAVQTEALSGATFLKEKGTLFTLDNLALAPEARSAPCALANGCELTPSYGMLGSLFEFTVSALAMPLREAPHERVLVAQFRADATGASGVDCATRHGAEKAACEAAAKAVVAQLVANAKHKVVVTGELPLSAFNTMKIPEFVPVA